MVTAQDLRTVTFEKNVRGYNCEDVDTYLQQAAKDLETVTAERNALQTEKARLEQQMNALAQRLSEYHADEENIKGALLSAQRTGDKIIQDSKEKAGEILREATAQSEDLAKEAKKKAVAEQKNLERVQNEVARFKTTVLAMYKQHIESLSNLPEAEEAKAAESAVATQQAAVAAQAAQAEVLAPAEDAEETTEKKSGFWSWMKEKTEDGEAAVQEVQQAATEEKAAVETAEEDGELSSLLDGFKGIQLDD